MKAVVISGGTATNSLVHLFSSIYSHVTYALPISDNGGSTSEIIRVIGGPAIGDIRSRVIRLIPDVDESTRAMRALLSYRLPDGTEEAKVEWNRIVDGTHRLWNGVESQYKEMIRPFFIHIHVEFLKRSRPGREFRFERASIGNLFLTGARLFCGSLDSAIELLCKITMVPSNVCVLPALNTNFSHHISAVLENGTEITGQSQISHPSADPFLYAAQNNFEDANLPFSHPALSVSQLKFSKTKILPLESPIRRIFYINPYGQEIHPKISPRVAIGLESADAVVYSIGSLYTSLIPVVSLQGFAQSVQNCLIKILILNGEHDRESNGMNAEEHVNKIVEACQYSLTDEVSIRPWTDFVTDLVHMTEPAGIPVDTVSLEARGIRCHRVPHAPGQTSVYDLPGLEQTILHIMSEKH
jgi:2-phospho-L-lactate transferase/gluconeogenesis factor (CofD/UPF0052 family)